MRSLSSALHLMAILFLVLLSGCQRKPGDLVDIKEVMPDVRLDIRYATDNNFTKTTLYPAPRCILRYEVAQALAKVQEDLRRLELELVIYDCYRPLSVQRKMWEIMPNEDYVANPEKGSRHNRGAAVDVGLYDKYGKRVDMGTDHDDFSERAHHSFIDLPASTLISRQNLLTMMEKNGFAALATEWWHYDFLGWQNYPVMDIPFDDIPQ